MKNHKFLGHDLDREQLLLGLLSNQLVSPILCGRLIRTSLFRNNDVRFTEGINHMEDFSVTPRLFYFASTVSGISDFIYLYNRQNANSYTFNYERDWVLQMSALKSYEINQLFFVDKEPKYKEALALSLFNKHRELSIYAIISKNKDGFNYCKRYIENHKYLYSTVKYPQLAYLIESNYCLARVVFPLRLLRANILSRYR